MFSLLKKIYMPMAGLDPAPSALLNAVYKHGNLPTDLHGH